MNKFSFPRFALAIGFLSMTLGGLSQARASYFVSTLPGMTLNPGIRTHILVTSKGNDLGDDPEEASLVKAQKIAQANPHDQVIVFNVRTSPDSQGLIRRHGFVIQRAENSLLSSKRLVDEMVKFTQIASFNAFGHSGVMPGIFLDGVGDNDLKWRTDDPNTVRLQGHFTPDAYAILNGCNAGHTLAPTFSKIWGIPVAGALTYAHFEVLFQNGNYYWADDDVKTHFVRNAKMTIRMKVDDVTYNSPTGYGVYPQGLPFYKFFCNGIDQGHCMAGIKASVYSLVSPVELTASSSKDDFMKAVREWLCPTRPLGIEEQAGCMKDLESIGTQATLSNADREYTPFRGPSIQCTMKGCYPLSCMASPAAGAQCAKETFRSSAKNTVFVDEYMLYSRAFDAKTP